MSDLYDTDTVAWAEQQGALLRRRAAGELVNYFDLDWSNIAEEIESLGKSERRELANSVATVLEHLMKLEASPATDPRRKWAISIVAARRRISDVLRDSPTLRETVGDVITAEIAGAREDVLAALKIYGEVPQVAIEGLIYTPEEVLGPWFPDRAHE
jgi:Domain of unknown function DUF29